MKKTLAGIIAAAMAATAMLTPTAANAWNIDGDSDDIAKATKGMTEIQDIEFFDWTFTAEKKSDDYRVFTNEDGTQFLTFNRIDDAHDIQVKLADGVSKEDVENALYEEYKDYFEKVQFWLSMEPEGNYCLMRNCTHSRITMQEAIEYLEFMREQQLISNGKLITNRYNMRTLRSGYSAGLLTYRIVYGNANMYETFCDYVEKELEGYSVFMTYTNDDYCLVELVPPDGKHIEEISLDEKLEITRDIYDATHLSPRIAWEQSGSTVGGEVGIDVYNAVKGDANCDGKVTVADPVAILQNIANKDKYNLSAQGKFNGDVTGEYDGLTAADAYELQVIDSQK